MRIECHYCGKHYSLRDENVGSHFRCGSCGKLSPVSRPDPAQPNELGGAAGRNPPAMRQSAPRQAVKGVHALSGTASPTAARPVPRPATAPAPAPTSGERWAIDCRYCGRTHSIRPETAGKQFVCKGCGQPTTIVPPEAASEGDEILVAMPIASAPAMPTAQVLPTAEIVYTDDDVATPVSPGDDLFGDFPAAASSGTPLAARPLIRPIAPPAPVVPPKKKKKKKRRRSDDDGLSAILGRLVFGLALIAIGCGFIVFVVCLQSNENASFRFVRPGKAIGLGIGIVILGIGTIFGRYFRDN